MYHLIIRRGWRVSVTASFPKKQPALGDIGFEFRTGPNPSPKHGTLVFVEVDNTKLSSSKWDMISQIDITINIPPNAPIGRYNVRFYIRKHLEDGEEDYEVSPGVKVYILANPFDRRGGCFQVENTTLKPMNGITVTLDHRRKTLKTDERFVGRNYTTSSHKLGAREMF